MGFVVRKLNFKSRSWKVQYQIYKGGRRVKDVKTEEYASLGLHHRLSYEEAKAVCKTLNSAEAIKKKQEKLNGIRQRLKDEDLVLNAFLPEMYLREFEAKYVHPRHKGISQWRTVKKCIFHLKLDIKDWNFYQDNFYRYFQENNFSFSYVQKIVFMLNCWGKFLSYKQQTFFAPIDLPRGASKERIVDNHESERGSSISDPISPEELESKAFCLKLDQYNWLYLSIWLGLRPLEIDNLKKETHWRLDNDVLWVYQNKLTSLPKAKRMKPIPLKYPEQKKCIQIIQSKLFKRPLVKTLRKYFNKQVNCYAGRKGFFDLMLRKGNNIEAISQWLGHTSIDRTWRSYKDKKQVLL